MCIINVFLKLTAHEYVMIGLDDSLGWKLYFLRTNTSFYHHFLYYPDGKPPESVDAPAKTKTMLILLDEIWKMDKTDGGCSDDESYMQIGKESTEYKINHCQNIFKFLWTCSLFQNVLRRSFHTLK